jgi:hypothetical protein
MKKKALLKSLSKRGLSAMPKYVAITAHLSIDEVANPSGTFPAE